MRTLGLQTRLDPHALRIVRHWRATVTVITGTAKRLIIVAVIGARGGLGGFGLFPARLRSTFEREADQHENQVNAESDHAVHEQIGDCTPGVVANLEGQIQRGDGDGRRDLFLDRVNDGRAEQQHRHQHAQRLAQPAPHPGSQAHPYQQAAHSGKGVEAPGDQIVVLGHGVHGKAGKEALIVTTFRPSGLSQ